MGSKPDASPDANVQVLVDGLLELAVTNLGVVNQLRLVFGPGLTAITGETGAGKTLLLTALELLTGGRAEAALVGPGGEEAVVSGRFLSGSDELVLERIVPRDGRSRAYLNGRPVPAASLVEQAETLLEIHGQHAHQTLGRTSEQRAALDRYAGIDLGPLAAARLTRRQLAERLADLGGDERERLRQESLYRYQVDEIERAHLEDPDEEDQLRAEAAVLDAAEAIRHAAAFLASRLGSDGPTDAALREALAALAGLEPLAGLAERLRSLTEETADLAAEARRAGETVEDDPERLEDIHRRLEVLADLRRKYGDSLDDVMAYAADIAERLAELQARDERAAAISAELAAAEREAARIAAEVGAARRGAAPALAEAVQARLAELALPSAALAVQVGADDPGDAVELLLSTNRGSPPLPLAKVASGGELSRTMLALRLVLSAGPPIMVFDEVDAGVGGAAALAVGRALAEVAKGRQVFVVTHLPQVAAYADQQIQVTKTDDPQVGRTRVRAELLDNAARVVELARMLSGSPDSATAQTHAAELLAGARRAVQASPKAPGRVRSAPRAPVTR